LQSFHEAVFAADGQILKVIPPVDPQPVNADGSALYPALMTIEVVSPVIVTVVADDEQILAAIDPEDTVMVVSAIPPCESGRSGPLLNEARIAWLVEFATRQSTPDAGQLADGLVPSPSTIHAPVPPEHLAGPPPGSRTPNRFHAELAQLETFRLAVSTFQSSPVVQAPDAAPDCDVQLDLALRIALSAV
jgi:hypothetical protein